MTFTQEISLFIYNMSLLPMIFFSILFIMLAIINLLVDDKKRYFKSLKTVPFVSIQIPTFNDPIAERCIKRCMEMDYPKNKFEIIIVDDSTNQKTQEILSSYAKKFPSFIKFIHRDNRIGFKPGALKNAMKFTKGEIIVIFDADWIPKKNFLKDIVKPFSDPKVAIVQTKQGFYNKDKNVITKFASYLLLIYHSIIMPIHHKANSVFFCGTAGALRRKTLEEVGGWNLNSITEDSDLTVRILLKGYKTVYLDIETPSEVPETFESFVKQQMRWCYGNVRVFFDHFKSIVFGKKLSIKQKLMISYVTFGNVAAPFVVIMTIFGLAGWFLGDPELFKITDLFDFFIRFGYTAGFLIMGIIALAKEKRLRETGSLLISAFSVGLVLAIANSFAFFKAIFNKGLHWHCTPKVDNEKIIK